jgi:AcrR family transcriptional regulator
VARARATDDRALMQAAAKVFNAKGYRSTTIDDIAEAAKISRPTVYSYAKSKRWLFDRIINEMLDDLAFRLESSRNLKGSPADRLRAVVDTHIEAAVENRTFLALLLSAEADLSPATRKKFRAWARRVTDDFEAMLTDCLDERAVERGLDPAIAANLIVSMLTSLHRWYYPARSIDKDQLSNQVLMLVGGVLDHGSR